MTEWLDSLSSAQRLSLIFWALNATIALALFAFAL